MAELMLLWYIVGVLGWIGFCLTSGMITVGDVFAAFFVGFTGPLLFLLLGFIWLVKVMDHLFSMVLWKK